MSRKKKVEIVTTHDKVVKDNPVAPPGIFTDVEREIIRADMAYLKQQEIESGAWAKWEESQKPYLMYNNMRRLRSVLAQDRNITRRIFIASTGRAPEQDDLERCNCEHAGLLGHTSCGWCQTCNMPKFACLCNRP